MSVNKADHIVDRSIRDGISVHDPHDPMDKVLSEDDLTSNHWLKYIDTLNILDNIPVIVSVYGTNKFIYVNSTFCKVLGYTFEEAQQMNFWEVVHPDHREVARARGLARHLGGEAPNNYEFKALKRNGEAIWLDLFFAVLHEQGVTISGSIDITERKRLKEELQRVNDELEMRVKQRTDELDRINHELIFTNQNLNNLLRSIPYGVVSVNHSGDFAILNSTFSSAGDGSLEEIKTKLKELFIRGKVPFINNMIEKNRPFRDEEIRIDVSHDTLNLLAQGTPILNEAGIVNGGVIMLRQIKEVHRLVNRYSGFRASFHFDDIITRDPIMLDLIELAKQSARGMSNVLIYGESGTGKELFAQSIHNASSRKMGPFLAVNCGAIPRELIGSELFGYVEGAFTGALKGGNPGKFELANGGTIFLDEIGDLPLEQQAALLRVVQEKAITRIGGRELIPVDVRIICATNKDLYVEMRRGDFRSDLYYRLNVVSINIPPLRERPSDIITLFQHLLKVAEQKSNRSIKTIDKDVIKYLVSYEWPGNVREVQNVVERLLSFIPENTLKAEHLPIEIVKSGGHTGLVSAELVQIPGGPIVPEKRQLRKMMAESERNQIIKFLTAFNGNISRVAEAMRISRPTLYKKMETYRI